MAKTHKSRAWIVGAAAVLVGGLGLRLVLGDGGVGDRSAMVMAALLSIGVWLAATVLTSPRSAFLVTLALMALVDLAALPARNQPAYDDLQAFYRTDQVLDEQVPLPPSLSQPMLTVLAQPMFSAAQPAFALAGQVNGTPLTWSCTFQHGIQTLALPVPTAAVANGATADVSLHLTGSPSRETDYLLVYASSVRGGFLLSLIGAPDVSPDATHCTLQ